MVKSLIKIKPALTTFFTQYTTFGDSSIVKASNLQSASDLIWSKDFGVALQLIYDILDPINEAIKMSESDKCMVRHVIPQWQSILDSIKKHNTNSDSVDIALIEERCFKPRYRLQVSAIHILAWILDPANASKRDHRGVTAIPYISESEWRELLYDQFTTQGIHHVAAMEQFNEYWLQQGRFTPTSPVWQYRTRPDQFWLFIYSQCPDLAPLAVRLARTLANSVAAERSFLILNLTHTKLRNRLTSTHVDRLQFIYINERVLLRVTRRQAEPGDLEELEDKLLRSGIGELPNPGLHQDPRMALTAVLT